MTPPFDNLHYSIASIRLFKMAATQSIPIYQVWFHFFFLSSSFPTDLIRRVRFHRIIIFFLCTCLLICKKNRNQKRILKKKPTFPEHFQWVLMTLQLWHGVKQQELALPALQNPIALILLRCAQRNTLSVPIRGAIAISQLQIRMGIGAGGVGFGNRKRGAKKGEAVLPNPTRSENAPKRPAEGALN